jgi:hypothetical protein
MPPFIKLSLICFMATLILACNNGGEMSAKTSPFPSIKDVPASSWEKISQKKIYFGHQSVGYNIIDGIKDVMKENPQIKLNIIETSNPADFNSGILAHSRVGKNQDPESKLNEFVTFMEKGIGDKADIAAVKFCYVDITSETQIDNILKEYAANMKKIKDTFPENMIIHFTMPLTSPRTTWKTMIKKVLGKSTGYDDNIKRNEYNQKLHDFYDGKEPVFDMAAIESTLPDGKRVAFTKDGKTYYSLAPEYTDDGGHLNELGRKIVAEQLLIFLTKM